MKYVCLVPDGDEVLVVPGAALDVPRVVPAEGLARFAAWKRACEIMDAAGLQPPPPPPELAVFLGDSPAPVSSNGHAPAEHLPSATTAFFAAPPPGWDGEVSPDVVPDEAAQHQARALAGQAARGELLEPILANPGVVAPGPGPIAGYRATTLQVHATPPGDRIVYACKKGPMYADRDAYLRHLASCGQCRPRGIVRDASGRNVLPGDEVA